MEIFKRPTAVIGNSTGHPINIDPSARADIYNTANTTQTITITSWSGANQQLVMLPGQVVSLDGRAFTSFSVGGSCLYAIVPQDAFPTFTVAASTTAAPGFATQVDQAIQSPISVAPGTAATAINGTASAKLGNVVNFSLGVWGIDSTLADQPNVYIAVVGTVTMTYYALATAGTSVTGSFIFTGSGGVTSEELSLQYANGDTVAHAVWGIYTVVGP